VLGLDDLLGIGIFAEQFGSGRHGNGGDTGFRAGAGFAGGRGFFAGFGLRRSGVGGSNGFNFAFLFRRAPVFSFLQT
jgi:hypothetical protein